MHNRSLNLEVLWVAHSFRLWFACKKKVAIFLTNDGCGIFKEKPSTNIYIIYVMYIYIYITIDIGLFAKKTAEATVKAQGLLSEIIEDAWCLLCAWWFIAHGSKLKVMDRPQNRAQVQVTRWPRAIKHFFIFFTFIFQEPSSMPQASSIKHQAPSIKHQTSTTKRQASSIKHQ